MYKINEVAKITGISTYTLRYYENEGILPPIKRDSGGRRLYSDENLSWIEIVTCLKQTNMPIADIKEVVSLSIKGDDTIPKRREILNKHRQEMVKQLEELKRSIEKIDKKIAFYDGEESC